MLIHNEAWRQAAGGETKLGEAHLNELPKETVSALRASIVGRTARKLKCRELLQHRSEDHENYPVTLSPLLDPDAAGGVVAQFHPPSPSSEMNNAPTGKMEAAEGYFDGERGGQAEKQNNKFSREAIDNFSLGDHPFFQRFAEMLPTGLAILNHKADAVFVNQQFYELTTHQATDKTFQAWPQTIHPEDYERVMQAYRDAFESGEQLRTEFRAQGHERPWRLLLLTPLGHDNLKHESLTEYGGFICAVIDITSEKLTEIGQRKAAREAQERKEQQERFIDMISHEIRNPLSAVLHCAEDILEAVKSNKNPDIPREEIIEAADTITLCVNHQKNIVDDILSFSKLDASMLSLSPSSCQPKMGLANALKMFQPEIKKQRMQFDYAVDYSYQDHDVDWVKADMVRINQILVNLVTNAIKFTSKKEGEKKISVAIGASKDRPTSYPPNVVFFDTEDLGFRMDATRTSEWGNGRHNTTRPYHRENDLPECTGDTVYMLVAVTDTGIGISPEGQAKLFQRFRQATPKTEEIYGGSGLGLNISRKLCQLHGGEIGVSSKEGQGSTFGFFFKTRRAERPDGHEDPVGAIATKELESKFLDGSEYVTDGYISDEDIPQDLKEPPMDHIKEASDSPSMGEKYGETAEIAKQVKTKPTDEYQVTSRPGIGDQRKSQQMFKTKSETSSPREKAQTDEKRAHQPTILLVEDNVINQRILRRKLESKGFTVTTANNGREAVDAVTGLSTQNSIGTQYDCILMDQEMPVMDGNAATHAIRDNEDHETKHGVGRKNRILGVTANVRDEQKEEMFQAGMDDIIHKPYKIDEIVTKIRELMEGGEREKATQMPMR